MAFYSISFKNSAYHDLKQIDRQYITVILSETEKLSSNPYLPQSRKLKGSGSSFRLRVGDYRIIYQVDSGKKEITVIHVRHRKDVYRR